MNSPTYTDLFTQFQQHLSSAGGESHLVARLAEAADLIATLSWLLRSSEHT